MQEQLDESQHRRRLEETKSDKPTEVAELPDQARNGDEVYFDDGLYHYYNGSWKQIAWS